MAIVAVAFLASDYIAVAGDPKTGLPDKAMGIITAIVAGGVGFMTARGASSRGPVRKHAYTESPPGGETRYS